MSTFTTSMFDAIKGALNKESSSRGFADILKTTVGNSYEVRLLPNLDDPTKTFYHYYIHGWESFATGQYISALSPATWGERDPIAEARFKDSRHGTPQEKEKSKAIYRSEKWLVNAYVVNDPTDSDNNGTVKVLRFGKQLHKIIMDAIEGEDADQFGARIFDLGENGCSLRVKVDSQGEFPTYVTSRFLMPAAIDGMTDDKMKETYESTLPLEEVIPPKTSDELTSLLNEHYYVIDPSIAAPPSRDTSTGTTTSSDPELDEEVPMDFDKSTTAPVDDEVDNLLDDDKVRELLQGLDDD